MMKTMVDISSEVQKATVDRHGTAGKGLLQIECCPSTTTLGENPSQQRVDYDIVGGKEYHPNEH